MEPLAQTYYELLRGSTNPTPILVNFYKELFSLNSVGSNVYAQFARLVRIYGRELIYFALLDCADIPEVDLTKTPVSLITYFAKKRLGDTVSMNQLPDLTSLAKSTEKKLSSTRKVKIPKNPFLESESE